MKNCVKSGSWHRCTLTSYTQVKDELCTYGKLLNCGTTIVVPRSLVVPTRRGDEIGTQGSSGHFEDKVPVTQ